MKTIIHINQHVIKANKKNGTRNPPITVKTYKSNIYTNRVKILNDDNNVICEVIYNPDKPLKCGAHCWVTTNLKIEI